jgi:hypothetical protein
VRPRRVRSEHEFVFLFHVEHFSRAGRPKAAVERSEGGSLSRAQSVAAATSFALLRDDRKL